MKTYKELLLKFIDEKVDPSYRGNVTLNLLRKFPIETGYQTYEIVDMSNIDNVLESLDESSNRYFQEFYYYLMIK
jgi:hypothetical protein